MCWRMKHFMLSLACVLSSFTLCCMCFIFFHFMLHVFYLLSLYVACVLSSSTVCCMCFIFFHFMLHVFYLLPLYVACVLSSSTVCCMCFYLLSQCWWSTLFQTFSTQEHTIPGSRPSLQGYILTQFPGLKR